jgi:hypothetical protein
MNLVPIVIQWLWLSARHGSITLPSSTNPSITTGGMVGEGKMEYFNVMGDIALHASVTTMSVVARGQASLQEVESEMVRCAISYPIIVKPDLGWCGFGVRRVDGPEQLARYLSGFPQGERVVLQRWLPEQGEAGIFYMRHPGEKVGKIIGLLLRHFPRVVGDGVRSVAELIAADPRTSRLGRDGASEPCCDPESIPDSGEVVRVAAVGSTRVGGMYEDGSAFITDQLTASIDAIANDMTDFHVGRFDVKYSCLATLQAGMGFRIIEVNGAGSEAVHAWDPSLTLAQAYRIIFAKQRRLFQIGDAMRQRGHPPVGMLTLARHHLHQQALIKRYPASN